MGSGRGDRNQQVADALERTAKDTLQWGPVVVTGISGGSRAGDERGRPASMGSGRGDRNQVSDRTTGGDGTIQLQWGPVVVTGISEIKTIDRLAAVLLQWGPVVVTGIRSL